MALQTALTGMRWAEQFNTAFWSIAYEIRVSLLFPLLFWAGMRLPVRWLLTGMFLLQAVVPAVYRLARLVDLQMLSIMVQFSAGILLYRSLPSLLRRASALSHRQRVAAAFCSVVLYSVSIRAPDIHLLTMHPSVAASASASTLASLPLDKSLGAKIHRAVPNEIEVIRLQLGILGSVGVMVSAMVLTGLRAWLRHPWLLRLGALSYSIYLLHGTVLFTLIRLFHGRFPLAYLFPVYLMLVYIAAEAFHWAVDRPSILLGRKAEKLWLSRQRRSPAEALRG